MAIVQIPVGGQMIGIEVPDFAMESTQQDILDIAKDQLTALQTLSSALSGNQQAINSLTASNNNNSQSSQSIANGLKQNNDLTRSMTQKILDKYKAFENVFQEESPSQMLNNMFGVLGLGAVGAIVGTTVGILEKFGAALSKTGRVGIGLGENLLDVADDAASIGVTFDQFSAILATNGQELLNFGSNTGDGARGLASLVRSFQQASREMGYYGLTNAEMTQLLIEEAEMRRRTTGEMFRTDMALSGLADEINNNMQLQEAMARITGQDMRSRVAGQRAIQNNVIAQEFLSGQTGDFARKLEVLGSTLADMPGGQQIMDAFVASIATGRDYRSFDPELFVRLGQPVADMFTTFTQGLNDPTVGVTEFSAQMASSASGLRYVGEEMGSALTQLAANGDQNAMLALGLRNSVRELGSSEAILGNINSNLAALQSGLTQIRAIPAETERLSSEINNALRQLAMAILPGSPNSNGELLVDSIGALATSIRTVSETLTPMVGAMSDSIVDGSIAGASVLDRIIGNINGSTPSESTMSDIVGAGPAGAVASPTTPMTNGTPNATVDPISANPNDPTVADPAVMRTDPNASTPNTTLATALEQAFSRALQQFSGEGLPVKIRNIYELPVSRDNPGRVSSA